MARKPRKTGSKLADEIPWPRPWKNVRSYHRHDHRKFYGWAMEYSMGLFVTGRNSSILSLFSFQRESQGEQCKRFTLFPLFSLLWSSRRKPSDAHALPPTLRKVQKSAKKTLKSLKLSPTPLDFSLFLSSTDKSTRTHRRF